MQQVDLAGLDLNLLVALRALLQERHVTRAASHLHLSQPAVSRALGRLRHLFQDELLVRVGQELHLTPRAQELLGPLLHLLQGVEQLVTPQDFDPQTAQGTLRFAAPDILAYMLVPPLMKRLAGESPRMNVEIVQWNVDWLAHLSSGEIDLSFGLPAGTEAGFHSRVLASNDWVTVLRSGHPALQPSVDWTAEVFARLPHMMIGFSSQGGGHVDEALGALGLKRRVALRVPYATLSPLLIAETDLVLTTAKWLAEKLRAHANLVLRVPPVSLKPVPLTMVWHDRNHHDPRHRWLRQVLVEIGSGFARPGHSPGE